MKQKHSVEIKDIPEHIAYTQEYTINSYYDFFDEITGENTLQTLADQVEAENPGVHIPKSPADYNYFTHEAGKPITSPMHIRYYDMVDNLGRDCDDYKFVLVPEVTAAITKHYGGFDRIFETYSFLYEWIESNGYRVAGEGRSSAIHGPWDCDNSEDYLLEVQIPVEKK
jgi:effector-binding domain-containing protein